MDKEKKKFRCHMCRRWFTEEEIVKVPKYDMARIVLFGTRKMNREEFYLCKECYKKATEIVEV